MKAYTDVNQSKKLAEILPLESADMCFDNDGTAIKAYLVSYKVAKVMGWQNYGEVTPCWSLAALLAQMPCVELQASNDEHHRIFWHDMYSEWHTNPVDACVELILRERKEEENEST